MHPKTKNTVIVAMLGPMSNKKLIFKNSIYLGMAFPFRFSSKIFGDYLLAEFGLTKLSDVFPRAWKVKILVRSSLDKYFRQMASKSWWGERNRTIFFP